MKAKKFISAVCALAMTATTAATFVSAAGEDVIIKGDKVGAEAGGDFTLSFNLEKFTGEGFSGCEFAIEYDPSMIEVTKVTEGATLKTGATAAELEVAPEMEKDVTMVSKSEYDCFDYNIVKGDKKNTIAVLWCTGLDSSKYWASKEGSLVTISGKVAEDVKGGTEIPVNIVAIDRDGNKDMIFGYVDGTKDKVYSSAVSEQGLITIGEVSEEDEYDKLEANVLWADANVDGIVSAADLVAVMKHMNDPEETGLSLQGIVNANLYQADKNPRDFKNPDIISMKDLTAMKHYIVGNFEVEEIKAELPELPIKEVTDKLAELFK